MADGSPFLREVCLVGLGRSWVCLVLVLGIFCTRVQLRFVSPFWGVPFWGHFWGHFLLGKWPLGPFFLVFLFSPLGP